MPMAISIEAAYFKSTQQTDWSPSHAATEESCSRLFTAAGSRRPTAPSIATSPPICRRPFEREGQRASAGRCGWPVDLYFARAFKQSEGLTPHDYLVQHRTEYAQKLLANSHVALSEVAPSAGFFDQSHFARRFREYVGVPPSRYRAIARRGGQPERYAAV